MGFSLSFPFVLFFVPVSAFSLHIRCNQLQYPVFVPHVLLFEIGALGGRIFTAHFVLGLLVLLFLSLLYSSLVHMELISSY